MVKINGYVTVNCWFFQFTDWKWFFYNHKNR